MSLKERISTNLKTAFKARDNTTVQTLRLLLAAVHNREIEKRISGEVILTDEEVVTIIRREAKERNEAIEIYQQAGRSDRADEEQKELEVLKAYLPPE